VKDGRKIDQGGKSTVNSMFGCERSQRTTSRTYPGRGERKESRDGSKFDKGSRAAKSESVTLWVAVLMLHAA
jgi:hypothetical protein